MIPDRIFLRRCAHKNNLNLPQELEDWLLVHFEDEPYEDFNTASALEDMIHMYCQSYANGRLDVAIPEVLHLFLVFLLKSPVFFKVSPAYLEELLSFLVSP